MTFSAEDFAKALAEHDYAFQVGSIVQGSVINYDSDGAYIDIGGKSAAFLPIREAAVKRVTKLEDVLEIGETRGFLVVRDQDADGQVLLSIRQLEVKQLWEKLRNLEAEGQTLDVKVVGSNKGGVVVDVEGLRGFIPRSHLAQSEDFESLMGRTLNVGFLEVNQANSKLVLSERIAARTRVMGQLELGQLIEGTIVSLKPFGVFVEFQGITGLLHINQVSKNYVDSLSTYFEPGQPVKAVVVNLDESRNRISLSTKVLEKYPGEILKDPTAVMADAENRVQDVSRILAESDT